MTLMTYVNSTEGRPLFAAVVDGDSVQYVWPEDAEPWFDETRVTRLAEGMETPPEDETGWLNLATSHLGIVDVDPPYDDFETAAEAVKTAQNVLDDVADNSRPDRTARAVDAESAFDQISRDYPDFAEDLDSMDPQAMLNYVMMALGPIDPEGPNGWILRAADGNPREGDEDEWIHWTVGSTQASPEEED